MFSSKSFYRSLFMSTIVTVMAVPWLHAGSIRTGITIDVSKFMGAFNKPSMEKVLEKGTRVFYKKFELDKKRTTRVFNFFIRSQGSLVAEVVSSAKCSPQLSVPGKGSHKIEYSAGSNTARLLCHTDGSKGSAYSIRVKAPAGRTISGEIKVIFLQATGWKDSRSLEERVKDLESQNSVLKNQVSAMLKSIQRLKARVNAIDHKDSKAKACPYYYLMSKDGSIFRKEGEIIRNIVGAEQEKMETTSIVSPVIRNGKISILIKEEKDEVSFIDYLALVVNGKTILPSGENPSAKLISKSDDRYLILRKAIQYSSNSRSRQRKTSKGQPYKLRVSTSTNKSMTRGEAIREEQERLIPHLQEISTLDL